MDDHRAIASFCNSPPDTSYMNPYKKERNIVNTFTRSYVLIVLATVFLQALTVAQQHSAAASDSLAVVRLAYDWLSALKSKDVKALERIMADDFITTNVDGSVNTKEQEIAPFRTPDLTFDTCALLDLHVRVYGATAIARGTGRFTGKAAWGTFVSEERFTDVFLKRNGRWQAISSHSSAVRKKKP